MSRIQEWWVTLSRQQRLMGIGVLLGIMLVGGWLMIRQPGPQPLPATIPAATGSGQMNQSVAASQHGPSQVAASQASSHDTRVFVDVQGAVNRPGLYQFSSEMRVADALKAAGGLAKQADRQQINLATRLTDQQQVYVPVKGEKPTGGSTGATAISATSGARGSSSTASGQPTAVVNLNTATVADLQQLTGIGEKKAQKIVDYRSENGSFQSVADLAKVPGFGDKTVANLQDQLTTS